MKLILLYVLATCMNRVVANIYVSQTFDIMDAHTSVQVVLLPSDIVTDCVYRWISDVSTFPELDHQLQFGPTYSYEYNTRETYGGAVPNWSNSDPLNATWWHHVTEGMRITVRISIL
jgi:hypothetical protein